MEKRKGKHLTWNDRLIIERMLGYKKTKKDIAEALGVSVRTIYNEIKRATYEHTLKDLSTETRYNPDAAEEKYRENLKKKGIKATLKEESDLKEYVELMIYKYDYSPEAVLLEIQNSNLKFERDVRSTATIYKAIKKGYFENLTMEHLPRRGSYKRRKSKIKKAKRCSPGESIEKRPDIEDRVEFGHWEMDCVIGQQRNKKTLLVFTERKSRMEIVEIIKKKNTREVVRALNRLEKRYQSDFYKIFKTITVDNGVEFADFKGMEKALYRVGNRTKVYYCHPYSAFERASNENNNLLVRRFFPKGENFDRILKRTNVHQCEDWINSYPRRLLQGKSAIEVFNRELINIGCKRIC